MRSYKLSFLEVLITMVMSTFILHGQSTKLVHIQGEFQMIIPSNMSRDDAKKEAVLQAKIQALKNAFGEVVIQGNSTYLQSNSIRNESKELYSMISDSYVNGEWVKNKRDDVVSTFLVNNEIWIKAQVDGYGQALPSNQLNMTIACGNDNIGYSENNAVLPEHENFKVKLNSGEAGYLYIFMDEPANQTCALIFPLDVSITGMPSKNFIPANTLITLFDPLSNFAPYEIATFKDPNLSQEVIKLYFLFTPLKPLVLPSNPAKRDSKLPLSSEYDILPFDTMPMEQYQRWLHTLRSTNPQLQYTWQTISIY